MALIDVITKRVDFYKIDVLTLPSSLILEITNLVIFCKVNHFEVWEEEILETYVYDTCEDEKENFYRQHYLDKDTGVFFACSYADEKYSFKKDYTKNDKEYKATEITGIATYLYPESRKGEKEKIVFKKNFRENIRSIIAFDYRDFEYFYRLYLNSSNEEDFNKIPDFVLYEAYEENQTFDDKLKEV